MEKQQAAASLAQLEAPVASLKQALIEVPVEVQTVDNLAEPLQKLCAVIVQTKEHMQRPEVLECPPAKIQEPVLAVKSAAEEITQSPSSLKVLEAPLKAMSASLAEMLKVDITTLKQTIENLKMPESLKEPVNELGKALEAVENESEVLEPLKKLCQAVIAQPKSAELKQAASALKQAIETCVEPSIKAISAVLEDIEEIKEKPKKGKQHRKAFNSI